PTYEEHQQDQVVDPQSVFMVATTPTSTSTSTTTGMSTLTSSSITANYYGGRESLFQDHRLSVRPQSQSQPQLYQYGYQQYTTSPYLQTQAPRSNVFMPSSLPLSSLSTP